MPEVLRSYQVDKKLSLQEKKLPRHRARRPRVNRPFYKDIEHKVRSRKETAKHETKHALPIISFGKSLRLVSVEPTSEYSGVTIPASNLDDKQMQIAAMGSDGLSGNGSDLWKAKHLERKTRMSTNSAASVAKGIHSSYGEEIIDIISIYLANEGTATDSQFREFIDWAREDIVNNTVFSAEDHEDEEFPLAA